MADNAEPDSYGPAQVGPAEAQSPRDGAQRGDDYHPAALSGSGLRRDRMIISFKIEHRDFVKNHIGPGMRLLQGHLGSLMSAKNGNNTTINISEEKFLVIIASILEQGNADIIINFGDIEINLEGQL